MFVTGWSSGAGSGGSATVAYSTATGALLWAAHGHPGEAPSSMAVSPDGTTVFVTGEQPRPAKHRRLRHGATGARRWVKRHDGPVSSNDYASALAISPDGKTVYVAGNSWLADREDRTAPTEYVTIAYRTATGARLWARHYHNVAFGQDGAASVAVSPAGTVFVTGSSVSANGDRDYATIAYRG